MRSVTIDLAMRVAGTVSTANDCERWEPENGQAGTPDEQIHKSLNM
jgi:hypothetical protein